MESTFRVSVSLLITHTDATDGARPRFPFSPMICTSTQLPTCVLHQFAPISRPDLRVFDPVQSSISAIILPNQSVLRSDFRSDENALGVISSARHMSGTPAHFPGAANFGWLGGSSERILRSQRASELR